MLKRVLRWTGIALIVLVVAVGGFVYAQASAFDASIDRVYDVQVDGITASTDSAVIARGKHLVDSLGGCGACHGEDLGGKPGEPMGPLGVLPGANLTTGKGGIGKLYSDAQLARVIRHGVKADGKSLRFMPAQDFSWWPDDDLIAVVSYVRSVPPVDRTLAPGYVGVVGKVLDRIDMLPLDIARRIDHHAAPKKAITPQATPEYGKNIALLCRGCHGPGLSGGPIPGAPPDMPVPANITPHETGIKAYTEADFMRLIDTGIKKDGKKLDPFMPLATLAAMNETERKALWVYLTSVPPVPFGNR